MFAPGPSPSGSDQSASSGSSTSGKNSVPVMTAPVQVQPACDHNYEWTVSKKAIPTEDGEIVLKCTKCGNISARATIPAPKQYRASTGNAPQNHF